MSEKTSLFSRFFGAIWRFCVIFYRTLMVLSVVIFGFTLWMLFKGGKSITVEDNIALVIAPSGALVEQIDQEPGAEFFQNLSGEPPSQSLLRDAIEALDKGRDDARITLAILKLDAMTDAGLPQMQELAVALQQFRKAGKKVIAYGPWYEQSSYFLAAQADEVVIDPLGIVALEGFSSYQNYFKDALDKLGITMNVFRVGEYKSAVEPFTRNDMSPEAKAANLEWLGDLWRIYGKTLAESRKLPATAADDYVNQFAAGLEAVQGDGAVYAKNMNLVTHIEALKDFRARVAQTVGYDDDHGSFRQIHYNDYLNAVDRTEVVAEKTVKVALVVVQGEIVDGPGEPGYAGGDTVSDLLDQARRDEDVAAVVLRVNSPGGSVWASEQIRREVQRLRAEGKPVVASMSSVAASGGYWVSMDADEIWAHDSTITGSIGIFGLIPTLEKPLEKMGIHTDGVGTTKMAGALRIDRPISPEMAGVIQSQINRGYRDFIEGVAQARKLEVAKVNEIARGRVWSGEDAKQIGLVDHLGGLAQATQAVARIAKLDEGSYELEEFSPERNWTAQFLPGFFGQMGMADLPGLSRWVREWTQRSDVERVLRVFNDPRGIYAHCYCTPSRTGR